MRFSYLFISIVLQDAGDSTRGSAAETAIYMSPSFNMGRGCKPKIHASVPLLYISPCMSSLFSFSLCGLPESETLHFEFRDGHVSSILRDLGYYIDVVIDK